MILEQIAADTRLRLIEEKKLVSPEEMKEKALALAADGVFPRGSREGRHREKKTAGRLIG